MLWNTKRPFGVGLTLACVAAVHAPAMALTYDIDSSQSMLIIEPGEFAGGGDVQQGSRVSCTVPIVEQFPTAFEAQLQGTLQATRAGHTLTFSGGSFIDAVEHPGPAMLPTAASVGSPGIEDNLGGVNHPLFGNPFLFLAIRDAVVDTMSGALTVGQPPVSTMFEFTGGTLDIDIAFPPLVGYLDLAQDILPFSNQSSATVTESGETITIPLAFDIFIDDTSSDPPVPCDDGNPAHRLVINGQLVVTPSGSNVTGDFNDDGLWDCADIDELTEAIATMSSDLTYDMNDDGSLTLEDITDPVKGWLAVGGMNSPDATGGNPFLRGDANLDGTVDGSDFLAWNNNKFNALASWCGGDFNADGFVDGTDFLAWNNNKFTSSDLLVPEPYLGNCLLLLTLVMVYTRRP